jgi:hypothetical protein
VSVVEQYGGNIGKDNGAIQAQLTLARIRDAYTATPNPKIYATKANKYKCLEVAFLYATYKTIYGNLFEDLENDYMKGSNDYPTTAL